MVFKSFLLHQQTPKFNSLLWIVTMKFLFNWNIKNELILVKYYFCNKKININRNFRPFLIFLYMSFIFVNKQSVSANKHQYGIHNDLRTVWNCAYVTPYRFTRYLSLYSLYFMAASIELSENLFFCENRFQFEVKKKVKNFYSSTHLVICAYLKHCIFLWCWKNTKNMDDFYFF